MSIMLKNVRLSFPSLWQTEKFGSEDTGKYAATFILNKEQHKTEIDKLKKLITEGVKAELKVPNLPPEKICLKDGDNTERPEYQGAYIIKASTKKRPTVIDRDKTPLAEDDGKPYAGCYVNCIIDLWYQDNKFGKRINANLHGVQFAADGESFADATDVADEFEAIEEEEMF